MKDGTITSMDSAPSATAVCNNNINKNVSGLVQVWQKSQTYGPAVARQKNYNDNNSRQERYNKRLQNNIYRKCIATLRSKSKNMHLANPFIDRIEIRQAPQIIFTLMQMYATRLCHRVNIGHRNLHNTHVQSSSKRALKMTLVAFKIFLHRGLVLKWR